jgi:HEPN domain-containing protein
MTLSPANVNFFFAQSAFREIYLTLDSQDGHFHQAEFMLWLCRSWVSSKAAVEFKGAGESWMSQERVRIEAENHFRQAVKDLESAKTLAKAKRFAQAAFFAQQCAEKAIQAVFIRCSINAYGIPLSKMIQELPVDEFNALKSYQSSLDTLEKMYIPSNTTKLNESEYLTSFTIKEMHNALGKLELLIGGVQTVLSTRTGETPPHAPVPLEKKSASTTLPKVARKA